jgi:hypothetical protein
MSDAPTTIRISKELREELVGLGSKRDTYESIIRGLIKEAKK